MLQIKKWNPRQRRGLCPFHKEETPSLVYHPKNFNFKCFGCGRNLDLVDAYIKSGLSFSAALEQLFKEAQSPSQTVSRLNHGSSGKKPRVRTQRDYRHPTPPPVNDKKKVYAYWSLRKISKETIDYADVREDENGNTAFLYYDTNNVLKMVKYRPSRKINTGKKKMWCQKGADTTPLLFNMNRIDTSKPLLIVEGEGDCLAAIEAGYTNVVSVPFGSSSFTFFEECWEWLQQFDQFIISADRDEAGQKLIAECIKRLGKYRTRALQTPKTFTKDNGDTVKIKDLNEVLYYMGKQALFDLIEKS